MNAINLAPIYAEILAHPCTTFDKWRVLFTVDDAYRVTGAIRTFV